MENRNWLLKRIAIMDAKADIPITEIEVPEIINEEPNPYIGRHMEVLWKRGSVEVYDAETLRTLIEKVFRATGDLPEVRVVEPGVWEVKA